MFPILGEFSQGKDVVLDCFGGEYHVDVVFVPREETDQIGEDIRPRRVPLLFDGFFFYQRDQFLETGTVRKVWNVSMGSLIVVNPLPSIMLWEFSYLSDEIIDSAEVSLG